jgi:lysozyme
MASFVNSMIDIVNGFAITIVNGFMYQPVTKLKTGSVFTDTEIPISYTDQSGQAFSGDAYSSDSVLATPSFNQSQPYMPGDTTPPRVYPTTQPDGYQVPLGVNAVGIYSFSAEGLRQLKAFEGLSQRTYTLSGQKYIGYGHLLPDSSTTTYVSRDEADSLLAGDVAAAVSLVKSVINVQLTQGQFDALVDFAFTISPEKFKNSSVVQKINSGDIPGAATVLAQWVYATQNGIVAKVPQLVSRRIVEVQWLTAPIDPTPL